MVGSARRAAAGTCGDDGRGGGDGGRYGEAAAAVMNAASWHRFVCLSSTSQCHIQLGQINLLYCACPHDGNTSRGCIREATKIGDVEAY